MIDFIGFAVVAVLVVATVVWSATRSDDSPPHIGGTGKPGSGSGGHGKPPENQT